MTIITVTSPSSTTVNTAAGERGSGKKVTEETKPGAQQSERTGRIAILTNTTIVSQRQEQ